VVDFRRGGGAAHPSADTAAAIRAPNSTDAGPGPVALPTRTHTGTPPASGARGGDEPAHGSTPAAAPGRHAYAPGVLAQSSPTPHGPGPLPPAHSSTSAQAGPPAAEAPAARKPDAQRQADGAVLPAGGRRRAVQYS
jgi:hypothetical protein